MVESVGLLIWASVDLNNYEYTSTKPEFGLRVLVEKVEISSNIVNSIAKSALLSGHSDDPLSWISHI